MENEQNSISTGTDGSVYRSKGAQTCSGGIITGRKDRNGNEVKSGNVGTGYKLTINDITYTIVKKGDVNGDATVSILDAVAMLNSVKGTNILQNEYKSAAMVKNNAEFNITDVVLLLNYIKGTAKLGL